jgi:predicted  nucleic acid-binding Zn-ribbon protein
VKGKLQDLIDLQETDLRLEELALRKRRLPEMIEAAGRPLQVAQAERDSLKKDFDVALHDRKSREQDLAAQEQAISKLEDRAVKGEIKTNKEFQAHRFEIELAKKKKGEIEDQLLLLMEEVDTKKKELARVEEAVKTSEQRFNAEKTTLEGSVGALEEELAEVTRKRKQMAAGVEPSLLRTYDKLRVTRKGQALAGVTKEGNCRACRLQIEPQVVSDVKRANTVLTCSYCHRILYWAGDPVAPIADPEQASPVVEIEQTADNS